MASDLQLYEVRVSKSTTMYILAEDEDKAHQIAEDDGDDALWFADYVDVDEIEEINDIKDIGPAERKEKAYGYKDLTIAEWFAARDEDDGEPVVTKAELEEAGQLRLIP